MNKQLKCNLNRLLKPRHIAFVGGADAAFSAGQCANTFSGEVWGVNPGRTSMGSVPCFASVRDLPKPPDAVFIATPRAVTTSIIADLHEMGAGGVVCFTAGYGELGSDGKQLEQQLVEAAGDMALVGPNCYGVVNYTNGATLWPFGAGTHSCSQGIALIMQSGMLPANMTMNDRSVPITHIISAGNQSVLAIEDYMDALLDDDNVQAIGIYAEGIRDVASFSHVAYKALQQSKPIVIIKAGRSEIASALSVTHTGSLSGSDDAFQALFDRLGIIRCHSPVEMLETLKFLSVSGAPSGKRIAGFTCSGGDAAMLADTCEQADLALPQPDEPTRKKLETLLPEIATVSNPLDYTTPLWGNAEVMPEVFETMIDTGYDAAVVIQDFPPAHIHNDLTLYHNDALSFAKACIKHGIPAAVCSDLPENIDEATRAMLIEKGITPLQGLDTGVKAMANACRYGSEKKSLLIDLTSTELIAPSEATDNRIFEIVDEFVGKAALRDAGVAIPEGRCVPFAQLAEAADAIGYPSVLKAASPLLPHKTEAGAVKLNLTDSDAVLRAANSIKNSVQTHQSGLDIEYFLLEEMQQDVIAELLVGVTRDAQFGFVMIIASGGVLVELIDDKATLLLPVTQRQILQALQKLKTYPLLNGFRGRPKVDLNQLADTIHSIARFAVDHADSLIEMDVNPLLITEKGPVAADVMLRKLKP